MARTQQLSVVEDGGEPINLTQVLKRAGLVSNGGEAKALISEGFVKVNGEVEFRKRRKMAVGDVVQMDGAPKLTLVRQAPAEDVGAEPPAGAGE